MWKIQFQVTFGLLHLGKSGSFCHSVAAIRSVFSEVYTNCSGGGGLWCNVLRRQRSLSGPRQTSNLPPFSLVVTVPGSYWPGELSWLGAREPDWQASDPSTHAIVHTGLQVRILRNAAFKYFHHPADVELNDHGRIQTECLAYLDDELSADCLFKWWVSCCFWPVCELRIEKNIFIFH